MLRISTKEIFQPAYQVGAEQGRPYRFHLHFLTPDEREWATNIVVPMSGDKRRTLVKTDSREAFKLSVTKIENYAVEVQQEDGSWKVVPIESAADFLSYPQPEELYQEVVLRIRDNSGIDAKN